MTIQLQNNNLNYLIDQNLQMSIDYLFCHFKKLLEKVIQPKIIGIPFHIIMYQRLK